MSAFVASMLRHGCPFCGRRAGLVRVHGHLQCRACTAVVERCCDD